MIVMCSLRAMLLLWVVCFAESGLCGEEEFLSNDIGRQVYMTNLHVEKAKSGRRITKGNYRVFVLLEREHFKGNTAQRGWVTGDPSPKLAFPDVFTLPVRREDQLKTTLRWTLEVRNGSTASWKREGSSETPLSKMIGEDAEQHPFCMPLHHKRVPPRNYRRDPRDHAICMDVHDIGSNTFPPETALFTTPLEMVFGSCLGTMLVIWLLSGWAAGTAVQKPLKLVYLVPLGALGFVLWSRMQGIERVTQGRITLSNFEWGFDATGYGTDVEQDYHFELAISFPDGRNYTTNSTTVTAQAASRSPELFPWPNVIGWDYSPDALEATVQVRVYADGRLVEDVYTLNLDATAVEVSRAEQICAPNAEANPRLCATHTVIATPKAPELSLMDRLPGGSLYLAVPFAVFVGLALRGGKKDKDQEGKDAKDD